MVTKLLIGILLTAPLGATESRSEAEILEQAESAFQHGLEAPGSADDAGFFRTAAEAYEDLRRRGASNAALYGNLGNSWLLAGDLPRAIVRYRGGLRLAPGNADLQAGLSYARDQVVYSGAGELGRPPVEHRPPWLPRLGARLSVGLGLLFYGLCWAGMTRWWMTRESRLLTVATACLLLAFVLAAGLAIDVRQDRLEASQPPVVIGADGVFLHRGNGQLYPRSYEDSLNRGVEARLLFDRGHWLQIELAGGEVGWVERKDVLMDD